MWLSWAYGCPKVVGQVLTSIVLISIVLTSFCSDFVPFSDPLIKVVVVDVIVPSVRHHRVEYVRASITNVDHLLDAFRGAQSVIHVASLIPSIKMQKSKIIEIVNVDGTRTVIEACQRLGLITYPPGFSVKD